MQVLVWILILKSTELTFRFWLITVLTGSDFLILTFRRTLNVHFCVKYFSLFKKEKKNNFIVKVQNYLNNKIKFFISHSILNRSAIINLKVVSFDYEKA